MSQRVRRNISISIVTLVLAIAGCTGSGGPDISEDPEFPPPDATVRKHTGFDGLNPDADGKFTVGDPPVTATFTGGQLADTRLARTGDWAWLVGEGGSGRIKFNAPVSEVNLWFGNENEAEIIVPAAFAQKSSALCRAGDQSLDNSEAFGAPVFARGGFNDWGNSEPPLDEARFFNFGEGVYNAQFEIEEAGTYEFKIADGGWSIEYGNPTADIELDTPVELSGGPALGGANSAVVIPEAGCYNWQMTILDDSILPAPVAELVVSFVLIETDAELGLSFVSVLDENGAEIASFEGTEDFQKVEVIRGQSEPKIKFVDILSVPGTEDTVGIGNVIVDDFRFGTIADTSPRELTLRYTRPDGDYSATEIEIVAEDGSVRTATCVPSTADAFGCDVTFTVNGGEIFEYTVRNEGVADPGSPITVAVNDVANNTILSFAGSDTPVLRNLPALPLSANEVILYYSRPDGEYSGFGLHLFPTGSPEWTLFEGGEYPFAGIDEEFGAYFIIGLPGSERLSAPYSASPPPLDAFPATLGFVIHNGDEKDPGPDQFVRIARDGNIVFVSSGVVPVATTPPIAGAVNITGMAAHWVAPDTLLWGTVDDVVTVRLLHSDSGSILTAGTLLLGQQDSFTLDAMDAANPLPDAAGRGAHLAQLRAWTVPGEASGAAADLVRGQLVAIGLDAQGRRVAATAVQTPLLLDALYAEAAADIDLGVVYNGATPGLSVWAPTARHVAVNLYADPGAATPGETHDLVFDPDTGAWEITGSSSWDRMYYDYAINVYSPSAGEVADNVVTDPYSVSLSTGSAPGRPARSQIVNLSDADLAPDGWDELEKPELEVPEDIVLYELHVRDFSIDDPSVAAEHRGKYTAFAAPPLGIFTPDLGTDPSGLTFPFPFTPVEPAEDVILDEAGGFLTDFSPVNAGMQHLAWLAHAGLTHVHILPAFDFATVNEDVAARVELDAPVEALCAANAQAAALCADYPGMSIREVLEAQPGDGDLQQQIVEWMKDFDGFNWGYDPFHFNVPEGSYSTDPDGVARIREFRGMVHELSGVGLRTVLDVVYNHTNAAGNVSDKSVLDRVVPGYYHRMDEFTGAILQDSCCPDTAAEHAMMEKLIVDSTVHWVRNYKVDGFRFDIMAFHPRTTLVKVRDAVQSLTLAADGVNGKKIYLYGEGWNFGDVQNDRRFNQARQANLSGTGIGTFNDRMRDSVRGGGPFDSGISHVARQGFATGQFYAPNAQNSGSDVELGGLLYASDLIRLSMAGNLTFFEFEDRNGDVVRGDAIDYFGQKAGYTGDPQEIVNYAASHDNETLWDIAVYKLPADTSTAQRVRAQNLAQSILLLGQGIPFLHAGQDMLRSKSMGRNSFDSGDWFNRLDFSYLDNNFAVGEPRHHENQGSLAQIRDALKIDAARATTDDILAAVVHTQEMLSIRKGSRLFRLRTGTEVRDRVAFHNTGPQQVPGVIVQSISDGVQCTGTDLDLDYSSVVIAINATITDQVVAALPGESFQLHPVLVNSSDLVVRNAAHSEAGFFVPARTAAVFVQTEPAADCGALGVDVFVRGSMNDWGAPAEARFDLSAGAQAEVALDLQPELYFFKIGDDSLEKVDCGAEASGTTIPLGEPVVLFCGEDSQNLQLDLRNEAADPYVFSLNASNPDAPTLTVASANLDVSAPTIAITNPAPGGTVAGNVVFSVTATDNFAVTSVRFLVDGVVLGSDETPDGDAYSITWNTALFADGPHILTAEAEDSSGNTGTATAILVIVDSSLLDDDTPPEVTLAPVATTLTGVVTLTADASDPQSGTQSPSGVAEVRFFYSPDDGAGEAVQIDSDSGEPYAITWDTTAVANGDYLLFAEAVDGAGNVATSATQAGTVDNPGTFGVDLFVCGVIGDCASAPPLEAKFAFLGNDQFAATLDLAGATQHAFRVINSDGVLFGDLLDCGSESLFTALIPGESFALFCSPGANDLRLDLSQEGLGGQFVFALDAADPDNPVLTVNSTLAAPAGAEGDVTPPSVTITGTMPAGQITRGAALSGRQVVLATATDAESAIARVEFLVDDAVFWSDNTMPYEAPWDTSSAADGDHVLTARAKDAAGNEAGSDPLTVTLDNIGPYGLDMYPQGSWDPNFDLQPDQLPMGYLGSGIYQGALTLPAGTLRFKISDGGEFENPATNCGLPIDNTPAVLGAAVGMICQEGSGNAKLDVSLEPDMSDYVFTFDASRSLVNPRVTVTLATTPPDPVAGDTSAPTFDAALALDPPDDPITFPASNVTINAQVSDNNAVTNVTFLVDGVVIWVDFTEPYQAPWDSTLNENGVRVITALATDANGNIGSSEPFPVNLDNPDFGAFGVPMYVRGAFVDDEELRFGTEHWLVPLGGDQFESTLTIERTGGVFSIGFKVADADWTDGTNCGKGSGAPPFIFLNQQTLMACSIEMAGLPDGQTPGDISLNLLGQPQPGEYKFVVDASDFPNTGPTVTVSLAP